MAAMLVIFVLTILFPPWTDEVLFVLIEFRDALLVTNEFVRADEARPVQVGH